MIPLSARYWQKEGQVLMIEKEERHSEVGSGNEDVVEAVQGG